MQAACAQYSNVLGFFTGQYAFSTVSRPTGPSRAYATSSCDRASTEIVSSCTALTRRSTPVTPPRRAPGPDDTLSVKGEPPPLVGAQRRHLPGVLPPVLHSCLKGRRAPVVRGVRAR